MWKFSSGLLHSRFLFLAASRWNHSQWHWKNSRGYNETVDISLTATHVFLSNPRGFLVPCKVDFYHIPLCIYFCYVSLLFFYSFYFCFVITGTLHHPTAIPRYVFTTMGPENLWNWISSIYPLRILEKCSYFYLLSKIVSWHNISWNLSMYKNLNVEAKRLWAYCAS